MEELTKTIWTQTQTAPFRGPRQCDTQVDVAIIGAGITGLTAGVLLSQLGKKVAILEKAQIASEESVRTTAHLSEILDTRYYELISRFGLERARLVRQSSQAAIEQIRNFINDLNIPCDFSSAPGFLFAEKKDDIEEIYQEFEALRDVESDAVLVETVAEFPFPIKSALRIANQAQFHPRKYLLGLAEAFQMAGGVIYEETRVSDVNEGKPCKVITSNGVVLAEDVIVAAHVPISNRVLLHTKLAAYRSYVVAARSNSLKEFPGLYWDTEDPYHYIRSYGDYIIVGGEDHKTGLGHNEECFACLQRYAKKKFKDIREFPYQWSGQIIEPVDGLPYIGVNSFSKNVYVATGFSGNGLTFGTVAGMLLTDLILGNKNPWAELYDATRISLDGSIGTYISENKDFALCFIRDKMARAKEIPLRQIRPGEGAIALVDNKRMAVNRDTKGELHFFSPVCPHLGCDVHWNKMAKSWDCPCHGSRFDSCGKVVNGPAMSDLQELEPQPETRKREMEVIRPSRIPGAA